MRPVLLGMNNPLSQRPEHALFPRPSGCTGNRLLRLLQRRVPEATERDYLRAFDRRNLLVGAWSNARAREAARDLSVPLAGRTVVVLGGAVRRALGLPEQLVHPVEMDGVTWRQLPHPSGLNHWYNSEECKDVAALLLEELYLQWRQD